ncbi:MAG: RHS repeat-associated core domain-containing protein, partial [Burkholderiales bacterium]
LTSQILYSYDPHGRLLNESRTLASAVFITQYGYDSAGRMTSITYPSGRVVSYTLDTLGRIAQVGTTQGGTTQTIVSNVAYQPFGGVKSFVFGNGQSYTRRYDFDGRIAAYSLANQSHAVGFDAASRITSLSATANPTPLQNYGYDALDRLTSTVTATTNFGYSYDAVGNRRTSTVGANTNTYSYAAASNRLTSIQAQAGATRAYAYDANGSTINDGINQYLYDARGRMVQSTGALGTSAYQVNALGQRIAKTLPASGGGGGGGQTLLADSFPGPDGRPIDDQTDGLWKGGGKKNTVATVNGGQAEIAPRKHIQTVADFALPAAGLVLQTKLTRGKVALLNVSQDEGVIVRYAGTNLIVAKARDDDGDELTDEPNVRARFQLPSPAAVLTLRIELKPGSARVRIAAGSENFDTGEIALPEVRQGERYRIRLAAVKLKGQALSGWVDDVLLQSASGGAPAAVTTHFVYDTQARLIGEYTGQGTVVREYAYLGDMPLALFEPNGAVFYVHTDHLNTPRVITNQVRQIVWRWDQTDPFGGNVPDQNPSGLGTFEFNLRFPGQYADKETNLHYNYFRDYSPEIGRYVQSDPIGLAGGLNTFAYAESNPTSAIDPQGLASCIYRISSGEMTCISNATDKAVFSAIFASGNNSGGTQCKNNPRCTGLSERGPIPQGLWIWSNDPPSTKPDGRRLQPWIGNKTTRSRIASHSCTNALGPSIDSPFCSTGCVTGNPKDINRLNKLLDSETGNVLLVVD